MVSRVTNVQPNIRPSSPLKSIWYNKKVAPYIFVLPFIVSFLLFFAYPIYSTIVMSFQEVLPGATKFIGTANYENLFNATFMKAMMNSSIYTVLTIAVLIPLPLVLAVLLNARVMVLKNLLRATLFIPALVSVVVAGTIFRLIFGELDGSLLNTIVQFLGYESRSWLGKPSTAMMSLVVLALWRWMGVNLVYFLAGLQNIPSELYESADIDGANKYDKFFKITLPLLKPITIYVFTISIYGGLSMFVESYMMWAGNRSPNDMGLTIVGYLYRTGIEQNALGFGSAVGMTLLVITFTITVIQLNFFGMFRREDE